MVRRTALMVVVALVAIGGCGGDSGDSSGSDALTSAEREWCSLSGVSDEDAARFDLIFEAGFTLGFDMDAFNASAAARRDQFEGQGMAPDEAVRAVSDELLTNLEYVAACKLAFAENAG